MFKNQSAQIRHLVPDFNQNFANFTLYLDKVHVLTQPYK